MKKNLYTGTMLLLTLFIFSCKHKMEEHNRPVMEKVDTTGIEYTSKYICPMHCKGSGSDQPGVCPVCGMDYELKEGRN